jgi:hypothetical protein
MIWATSNVIGLPASQLAIHPECDDEAERGRHGGKDQKACHGRNSLDWQLCPGP